MAHGGAAHQDGAADQDRPADRAGPADLGRDGAERRAGRDAADIARLAAIWEMVADADPELAKRLPGYLSAAE
jgi:hypothetical protein